MDERIEKAFEVANYMATLSNQRRIILEEYKQKLIFYINGATFIVSPELITFTKTLIDLGYDKNASFVDSKNLPVLIEDVQDFHDTIVLIYFQALNEYSVKYADISNKRNVQDIVKL